VPSVSLALARKAYLHYLSQVANTFETLLSWIHVTNLENADLMEARALVGAALDELEDEDPRLPDLEACEDLLWQGSLPAQHLQGIADKWNNYQREATVPEGVLLEQEFRSIANTLKPKEWVTSAYQEALDAADDYEDGDDQSLVRFSDKMTKRLESAWETYSNIALLPEEITAESVVGHRLLLEGIQCWYDALEMLVQFSEQGLDLDEALSRAEEANRLLVAVEKLASRADHAA
jgi:hypothetical protein